MSATETTSTITNGDVSFWIRDAGGRPTPRPALNGDIDVDVAIIGAGLTGLWTAYYLKTARPDLEVAVIEQEFAGFGASGRNAGWMSAEPAGQFRRYAATHGPEAARDLQREMFGAIREAAQIARSEDFGNAVTETGLIHFASNQAQLARAKSHIREMKHQGWGEEDVQELSAADIQERVRVRGALGGYGTQHCVRVHPAKFVFGLARAVERRGVTIYEGTKATAVAPRVVTTERGQVRAKHIVEALEGYSLSLPGQHRRLLPMNSSMIITEPLSDSVLESIGWAGGELLGDVAHSFTYMHKTADSRIAIGGRGVPYNFASSFNRDGRTAEVTVQSLRNRLAEIFPILRDVRIDHTWTGVLGVPRDWCAAVNYDSATGIARAGGYVGHGVSGTNLAARTVADLLLGKETALTRLPWVGRQARNWEFEPVRWIGAKALYAAYGYADRRENATQNPQTHVLARIANIVSGR
ncbi:NAD(P)/FAD-dependent oxidoreductase [Arthrobacter sp. USHLN218]|uniref:NAD(P)/FAD-dependent oxidoreductase n=1 Tax=Arthrobacter sp. USHLN218 TaxID=3081232 RepID=UPI00301755BF